MDNGLLFGLLIFGLAVLFAIGAFVLYNKSDVGKSLVLMKIMRKHGPNSIVTIDLLQDIIRKSFAKDGVEITDISLVHEMGNRYHGIVSSGNETHEMTVIADNSGTVHYKIID